MCVRKIIIDSDEEDEMETKAVLDMDDTPVLQVDEIMTFNVHNLENPFKPMSFDGSAGKRISARVICSLTHSQNS